MLPVSDARACLNAGRRYDAGQKLDYLRATVELALDHPELGDDFRRMLADIVATRDIGTER